MMEWLSNLMGVYAWEGYSLIQTFLQTEISILLFARVLRKRKIYPLRVIASLVAGVVFSYLLAILKTKVNTLPVRVLCYLLISIFNFLTLPICYGNSLVSLLFVFCSGSAAYQIGAKVYTLLQNIQGINDKETLKLIPNVPGYTWFDWFVWFTFPILIYWLLSLLFKPKAKLIEGKRTTKNVVLLSLSVVTVVNVLICIARVYEQESFALSIVVKIFCVAFGFVVLLACAGILSRSKQEQQMAILDQLWKQDRAQFESVKASMDVINMKCHDLKHIINRIEGKLTTEELSSLEAAIEFYDSNIKTGNKVLDVVLCEKAMVCKRNDIQFSCMADGQKFTFLTPVQTYTLFGNIIDNAIEAVQKLQNPENKIITLNCREHGGFLEVEESNYFDGELHLAENLPTTTKGDPAHHGFGIKSIKTITELYGGVCIASQENNMFFLKLRFPLPRVAENALPKTDL